MSFQHDGFCAEGSLLRAPLPVGEAVEARGQQLAPADSDFCLGHPPGILSWKALCCHL